MQRRCDAPLDVMRVPVEGDPSVAVVPIGNFSDARAIVCEVLIVGGGTGGVAQGVRHSMTTRASRISAARVWRWPGRRP